MSNNRTEGGLGTKGVENISSFFISLQLYKGSCIVNKCVFLMGWQF
jgi:hypothetical protein